MPLDELEHLLRPGDLLVHISLQARFPHPCQHLLIRMNDAKLVWGSVRSGSVI